MFTKITVGTRLLSGFLAIAVLGAIVAAIGIFAMARMNDAAARTYKSDLLGLSSVKEANINLIYIARAVRGSLLTSNEQERLVYADQASKAIAELDKQLNIARPLYHTAEGKAVFADTDRIMAEYHQYFAKLQKLLLVDTPEGRQEATAFALGPYAVKANAADDKMDDLANQKEKTAALDAADAQANYESARTMMLVLVAASLATGAGLGLWITRSLVRQLGGEPDYAVEMADKIAAGELATVIVTRAGDSGSLLHAMESMRASLAKIVAEVRAGTETISTASSQIAAGNIDLSSRTEEQASSLEETASSMEELTGTVKQNADNAAQANVLAASASSVAVRGGSVVAQVVETMVAINDSSKKIVDIISVIDGIAFQTNILALNAAVEAARAGEQGRGFAVVASEVRNLAQRSATAAKEIKALINDSVDKVDAGGKLVNEAGATMNEIVQSITRVTDIMSEIASASAEQTVGIEQVNAAITQMDEVTQQNAALVEEAAAAAASMQDQASRLSEVVGVFKVDVAVAERRAMPRPAPRAASNVRQIAPRRLAVAGRDEGWETF